jgi:hypothetical protein
VSDARRLQQAVAVEQSGGLIFSESVSGVRSPTVNSARWTSAVDTGVPGGTAGRWNTTRREPSVASTSEPEGSAWPSAARTGPAELGVATVTVPGPDGAARGAGSRAQVGSVPGWFSGVGESPAATPSAGMT